MSISGDGAQANGESTQFAGSGISADGRYVTFVSRASNLVPGDGALPGVQGTATETRPLRVFVHDLISGSTELVSARVDGGLGTGTNPSVSADGRFASFSSSDPGLAPDATSDTHAYVRDRGPGIGIVDMAAVAGADGTAVSGQARFAGQVVISTEFPGGRPAALGPGCSYLSRFGVCPGSTARGLVVVYAIDLRVAGKTYQVRAARPGPGERPGDPAFVLFDCTPSCGAVPVASLRGGFGTAGAEVSASIPLDAIGADPGDTIHLVRASTAIGVGVTTVLAEVDERALADVEVDAPSVALGVAPAGTPQADVVFDIPASLQEGTFSAAIDPGRRLRRGMVRPARSGPRPRGRCLPR